MANLGIGKVERGYCSNFPFPRYSLPMLVAPGLTGDSRSMGSLSWTALGDGST
jgi:hypothetical protein